VPGYPSRNQDDIEETGWYSRKDDIEETEK